MKSTMLEPERTGYSTTACFQHPLYVRMLMMNRDNAKPTNRRLIHPGLLKHEHAT
jgi:hypothetical protein